MTAAGLVGFILGSLFLCGALKGVPNKQTPRNKSNITYERLIDCRIRLEGRRNKKGGLKNSFELILDNYTDLLIDYRDCKNRVRKR